MSKNPFEFDPQNASEFHALCRRFHASACKEKEIEEEMKRLQNRINQLDQELAVAERETEAAERLVASGAGTTLSYFTVEGTTYIVSTSGARVFPLDTYFVPAECEEKGEQEAGVKEAS